MTAVLCLDLATTTGWAFRTESTTLFSGTEAFKNGRFEGGGMRFLKFTNWLDGLVGEHGRPGMVIFEEVRRHRGTDAAHIYGGFLATLTSWCEAKGIPYRGAPVGQIKRSATGSGSAGKNAVIAAMRLKGHKPKDDNEADALAIYYWAKGEGIVA